MYMFVRTIANQIVMVQYKPPESGIGACAVTIRWRYVSLIDLSDHANQLNESTAQSYLKSYRRQPDAPISYLTHSALPLVVPLSQFADTVPLNDALFPCAR